MKYIKIGIFIIALSLSLVPLRVYAEDEPIDEPTIEEELEQSPIAKFYEEKIRPHGITMLTAFLGTAGGGYGLYTVLRLFLKRKIDKAIDKLALSQEQTQMLKGMNEQLLQKADELVETKLKQALDKIDEYAKRVNILWNIKTTYKYNDKKFVTIWKMWFGRCFNIRTFEIK